MRRIEARKRADERVAQGGDRRRVVPDMWVVAGLPVNEARHFDRFARRQARGGEKLLHPRVIAGTVVDDQPRARHLARGRRARLELVRILVGPDKDAAHRDVRAADLPGDVAVDAFGRNDRDRFGARRWQRHDDTDQDGQHEAVHGFVAAPAFDQATN